MIAGYLTTTPSKTSLLQVSEILFIYSTHLQILYDCYCSSSVKQTEAFKIPKSNLRFYRAI